MLIEIVRTFKYKEESFVNYQEGQSLLPYFTFKGDVVLLKTMHSHYTQIQVQLYILNLRRALLLRLQPKAFSNGDCWSGRAFRWKLLPILDRFYFRFLEQFLL